VVVVSSGKSVSGEGADCRKVAAVFDFRDGLRQSGVIPARGGTIAGDAILVITVWTRTLTTAAAP
jgi:hypothetical protein